MHSDPDAPAETGDVWMSIIGWAILLVLLVFGLIAFATAEWGVAITDLGLVALFLGGMWVDRRTA